MLRFHLLLLAIPVFAQPALDTATRTRVIDASVRLLNEHYVFPDVAKKMEEAIRSHQQKGEYDTIADGANFARTLTGHLREISKDKHLRVNYSSEPNPGAPGGPPRDPGNCGFEKVEILPGDIGYVKLNAFFDPSVCGQAATNAMAAVSGAKAIIFDLRENGGGSPRMVAYVATYLFAGKTHLNDLYTRRTNSTAEFWTMPELAGKRLADVPVYLLTASYTFSGGEEFAYDLKNLKRATIIGETTGGGAHPIRMHRIDDHFFIALPFARPINPISKTDWEGVGVEPDIKVPAAEALEIAKKMAGERR
jgi:hypothetical protein